MSAPAEICDSCGKTITDEELETGLAISVLGRSYCPGCKDQAVKDISIEDLAAPASRPKLPVKPAAPAPAPKAPVKPYAETIKAEPQKALKPAALSQTPRRGQPPAVRQASTRKGPNPAALAVAGVGILAAVFIVLLASRGGSKGPTKNGDPPPETGPKTGPVDPAAARLAKAEKAYTRVSTLAQRAGSGLEEVLAAVEGARADCAGTPFEARLEEIRAQKAKEKEGGEAAKRLNPVIDELRAGVAADGTFSRFAELSDKFQKARELALAGAPDRIPEISQLRQDYVGRYEKRAEPFASDIETGAKILADERRYDDAIAKIETFPRELRLSAAWKSLEQLRQDIERRKRLFPPKK
jgi:hypothetical protein